MTYLNTLLYLAQMPSFSNPIVQIPLNNPTTPKTMVSLEEIIKTTTTNIQPPKAPIAKKQIVDPKNFSYDWEDLPEAKNEEATKKFEKKTIYFIDQFPRWIADLKKVFPMLDFQIKSQAQLRVEDAVVLFDNSLVIAKNVIRPKGKKHLWKSLCSLISRS